MFEKLEVFSLSSRMAVHAGKMQATAAQNIANSDTPGYKAQSVRPFAETLQAEPMAMRSTRDGHISLNAPMIRDFKSNDASTTPDGNSVSIEEQMLVSVEAKRQHDRALAIYKTSMNVLRTSIGR